MADSQDGQQQNNADDDKKYADEFWTTHKEKTIGILDEWWAKNKPGVEVAGKPDGGKPPAPEPGTSRTGGKRPTLKGLIADVVFGPPKE